MLRRWSIENFKSFRDRSDVILGPINVFAGANSSGKSTIIQSILLIKQTLQYAPATRSIALNGPLLKLGIFNDIKNSKGKEAHIGLGWELEVDDQKRNLRRSFAPGSGIQAYSVYNSRSELRRIICETRFDLHASAAPAVQDLETSKPVEEVLQLQPSLAHTSITAFVGGDLKEPLKPILTLDRTKESLRSKAERFELDDRLFRVANAVLAYDVTTIDQATRTELIESKPGSQLLGCSLQHFFPYFLGIKYEESRERARRFSEFICGESRAAYLAGAYAKKVKLPSSVIKEVRNYISQRYPSQEFQRRVLEPSPFSSRMTLDELVEAIRLVRARARAANVYDSTIGSISLSEIQPRIENLLIESYPHTYDVEFERSRVLTEATEFCRNFFINSVRYLGPLRDEPKPVYPPEVLASPTEVGYKGEHTAAVLDLYKDSQIQYIPSSFLEVPDFQFSVQTASLHDAVVDWLSYVGVAEEVRTDDRGKFGHQLQVKSSGIAQFHDLTNVGVGVSQVLPIIVMALLAGSPSLLIFEQPELHLHPKVQAKLADFFLSVAMLGKQCILETHSEYLIERFRLRIAQAKGDRISQLLKIYFTERKGGETVCRPVEVSKFGAVIDYPEDFFDQSLREIEGILSAAQSKRKSEDGRS